METQQQERKNFAQQNAALFSSAKEDWATPQDFFDKLNEEFGFDLDPCASEENHKCEHYYTKQENGLLKDWGGALRVLQSTLRESFNRGMDKKMCRRSQKAKYNRCFAYTGPN